jgi:large-conductance mechanosensitive channel
MFKDLREYVLRPDLTTVTVAVILALALFSLIETLVGAVLAPLIAAVFDKFIIEELKFSVRSSEVSYGAVISAVLVVLSTLAAIHLLTSASRDKRG